MPFQDNLKSYRMAAGYKQAKDFADVLGVNYATYVAYENRGREPRYDILCRIAKELGVTTDELLGYGISKEQARLNSCVRILRKFGFSVLEVDTADASVAIKRNGSTIRVDANKLVNSVSDAVALAKPIHEITLRNTLTIEIQELFLKGDK
jgi:transcriptional regulator with XRE-family HTH domain